MLRVLLTGSNPGMTQCMRDLNQRPCVLIVDDSFDSQVLLRKILELEHCTVHCTPDGHKALTLLQKMKTLPDLILLDLRMPLMGGYAFRARQLADERLKSIPIALTTADDDLTRIEEVIRPEHILAKPLSIHAIREVIKNYYTPLAS